MPSAKRKPDTGRWIALLTAVPAVIAAGRPDCRCSCRTAFVGRRSGRLKSGQSAQVRAVARLQQAQMREDAGRRRRLLDGADDPEFAATLRAVLKVNIENSLEPCCKDKKHPCSMGGNG